jgi:hypothetical protein
VPAITDLRVRVAVAFAYAVLLLLLAVFFPSSRFISGPFAWLFFLMLKPFIPVVLGADGVSLYVGCSCLNVTDVCSLMPLIGLVAVFLWVRGVRWLNGVAVLAGYFALNLVRVFGVAFALANLGFEAASRVHDLTYAAFTILAVGIIAYCSLSVALLRRSGEEYGYQCQLAGCELLCCGSDGDWWAWYPVRQGNLDCVGS